LQDDGTVIEGIDNVLYPSGPVHNNLEATFSFLLYKFNKGSQESTKKLTTSYFFKNI